jgi:ABC-type polysaccharide/polyol phosphate transport system ATPase subunit
VTPGPVSPVIALEHVSKRYWQIKERSLLRALIPIGPPNRSQLWALRDVDLTIDKGETVGIIGRNGAGKSTLLRLLAGVSQPTTGQLTITGRIAPLLSVGVGFHQEMTGRENVFVNGMLLGLTRAEIRARFDDIVAFAELADFIDTPVKFYSTGMFMRLGFSVAIHVRPDVLIVDEVLAVGDIAFQLRCLNRMRDLQRSGTTIVFVSHHLHAIHLLCPRTVVIHRGRVEFDGPTEGAMARYHQLLATVDQDNPAAPVQVLSRELLLADGTAVDDVQQDQVLTYRLAVRFDRKIDGPGIFFRVLAGDGVMAYSMQTSIGDQWRVYGPGDEATVVITFRPRLGGGGTFHLSADITDNVGTVMLSDPNGPSFFVPPRLGVTGPADLEAAITIDGEERTNHRWARIADVEPRADPPFDTCS